MPRHGRLAMAMLKEGRFVGRSAAERTVYELHD